MKTFFYWILLLVFSVGFLSFSAQSLATPAGDLVSLVQLVPLVFFGMSRVFSRRIGSIPFELNGIKTPDSLLPRDDVIRAYPCRLSGDVTIATAVSVPDVDAPWSLIKQVDIIVGGVTVRVMDGPAIARMNHFYFGAEPTKLVPTAIGTFAFTGDFYIPFALPRSIRPIDTVLDPRGTSSIEFRVRWGALADYGTNVTAIANASLEIFTEEVKGFNGGLPGRFRILFTERDITAVNPAFNIDLNSGIIYRGFLFRQTNAGVPVDSIVNNVKIFAGSEIFLDLKAYKLREVAKREFGLETHPIGYLMYEFPRDGFMTQSLDSRGIENLKLELDVANPAGVNKVRIYPLEITLPVQVQKP